MGYRSDSIAISRDMGQLSPKSPRILTPPRTVANPEKNSWKHSNTKEFPWLEKTKEIQNTKERKTDSAKLDV